MIQMRLYWRVLRSSAISPKRNVSKIQKINRPGSAELKMKLLFGIKQLVKSFFIIKMAPVQSITEIVLLSFLTNTAPQNVYFLVHYHLFLRKK